MRIKICGITNINDAINAINAGAHALGFVFYKKSPRYITPQEALKIIEVLPPFVQTVGLFVNENVQTINQIAHEAKMQLTQIIDDEHCIDYSQLNQKYIKVIRATSQEDIKNINNEYVLVDAFVPSFGGEGKRVALEWFKDVDCSKIILAGGLKAENLKELRGYGFFAVDVSSGVEASKGKKDNQKMIDFVKAAHAI
ncbi:MAG: phosphoribosylanthranilate isomerase [Candidatus Marinarcus sp.]|uniref:phosphoribosylanthranilate isomerase n=1 Tax=Candidatus Marinarcus sp. TaxID=3100987 RepID=UPI003B008432